MWSFRAVLAVVSAVLLAGCAGTAAARADRGTATATATATTTATTATATSDGTGAGGGSEVAVPPQPEPSGPEVPANTGGPVDRPSVRLPQLPIGGNSSDPGDGTRCAGASYLGDAPIPPGVRLVVTGAEIEQPRAYFRTTGAACDGLPPCVASGFAWTADTQNRQCSVVVRETGITAKAADPPAQLVLRGRPTCPPGEQAVCAGFVDDLTHDHKTISLDLPLGAGNSGDGSSPANAGPRSDPAPRSDPTVHTDPTVPTDPTVSSEPTPSN